MEDLDDDDRFLIRSLYRKGRELKVIAGKRQLTTETVQDVIDEFKKKGSGAYRAANNADDDSADWREAAFWFFQHVTYVSDNAKVKYKFAIKKADTQNPGFEKFLEMETKRHEKSNDDNDPGLDANSKWSFVDKLWLEKHHNYAPEEDEDTNWEARNQQQSTGLMTVDTEELHMNAVCQIFSKEGKLLGCGAYVKFGYESGILTLPEVLESEKACLNVEVKFDTMEGDVCGSLKPDVRFLMDKNLNTTFVAFAQQKGTDDIKISPLEQIKAAQKGWTIYGYYHDSGGQKIQIQKKVVNVESGVFYYNGNQGEVSKGMPIYCEQYFIGLDQGKIRDKNTQIATDVKKIEEWVEKNPPGDRRFSEGDKILATWTDGFSYDATIKYKTELGYMVYYDAFKQEEDQGLDTIEKKEDKQKTKETTTTASPSTTQSVIKPNETRTKTEADEDDIDLIGLFTKKGKDAKHIADILNLTVMCVQKVIDGNKKKSNVNQNQLPFDEVKWQVLCAWLKKANGENTHYIDKFKEYGCHSIDVMIAWPPEDRITHLTKIGVKAGTQLKLQNMLAAYAVYQTKDVASNSTTALPSKSVTSSSSPSEKTSQIAEVNNMPMPEEWEPTNELDLTETFIKPGTSQASVSYAIKQIIAGVRPSGLERKGKEKATKFYVNSARHTRYFEITVTWVKD